MARFRLGLAISVLLACEVLEGQAPAWTAEGAKNEVLKKKGLTVVGSLAVLETESAVKNKLIELRRLSKQLNYALMQQQGTMSADDYQQSVKGLGAEINQLKAQISALTQQINRMPRGRRGFANNFVAEQYAELNLYRAQLQNEVNQETAWLNQLKSQKFDPKAKEKVDGEVRDRRETYHQLLLDLRKLVDDATDKYAELAKDQDLKKALEAVSKAMGTRVKLGPSHEFSTNVKLLEKCEKAESTAESDGPAAKPARRSKVGTKSKRTSRSHSRGGATASSDEDSAASP
jgi:hypothetical protein